MTVLRSTMAVAAVATLCSICAVRITASDQLNRAKDLYRSASYDDALTVLNAMTVDSTEAVEVQQYQVLCLIALNRRDEARVAMAGLISTSPLFRLPEEDTSPRVRALFAEVRKSVLPGIVQRTYADAKAAFDRKDPDASARFDRVLELLKDPDVASDASLADLATVASGFRDLSKAATAATTVSTPAAAPTAPPAATTAATARRSSPPATASAVRATAGVIIPPVAISQVFPSPPPQMGPREWDGEVELVIDPAGKVLSARITKSIHPSYDQQLLRAARTWTYRPATRDGVATQMAKLLAVHLDTRPACGRGIRGDCRPVAP